MRHTITYVEVIAAIKTGHQRFKDIRAHLDVGADLLRHTMRQLQKQNKIIASSNRVWFVC